MADLKFLAHGKSESATRIDVEARGFTIVVDEPQDFGGTDKGPTPVEYKLAALIGCLNVAGHIVAREMGLDLGGIEIHASGALNADRLLGRDTSDRAGFKEIEVSLKVDSSASVEELEAWLSQVKDRCPVSDNLGETTPIRLSVGK
ncbi:MAG TPA: OsmC family protein [Polyangiaceae bacterium LLY-WYZ-14_1]|nr:OsmC family protein [Polyangiaceae bacterium LLY-WYZ-14_1]